MSKGSTCLWSGAAAEAKSGGRRSEDAYFIGSDWVGVADGVGSWYTEERIDAGDFARELMTKCKEILALKPHVKDEDNGLLKVMAEATRQTKSIGSSTVLLAGGLADGKNVLHIANMGDSGCLVIRNGKLLAKSTFQTAGVNFPFQVCNSQRPKDKPCAMDPVMLGEVLKVPVQSGDIVICATDGLFDSRTLEEVVVVSSGLARDGASPQALAEILMLLGRYGWKEDDITVVVSLVVDDSTVGFWDTWANKVLTFASGIAAKLVSEAYYFFGKPEDHVLSVLLRLQNMGGERYFSGLDDDALKSKLEEMLHETSFNNNWRRQKTEEPDFELPVEVKQVLDDYASGKLSLVKYKGGAQVVSCEGKPCLLLSHLGDETEENLGVLQILEEKLQNSMVMLAGGHGSGKTRLLYKYLCSKGGRGGLYLTVRKSEEHWGSSDFEYLVTEVLSGLLRPIRPDGRRNHSYSYSLPSKKVGDQMKLLLAARMRIYEYCRDRLSDRQWLVLQAACRALVYSDGTPVGEAGDVFKIFLAKICKQKDKLRDHWKPTEVFTSVVSKMPVCVIDDIEQCRMALHGCFSDRDDLVGLGLARALGAFFQELGGRVVFSGAAGDRDLLEKYKYSSYNNKIVQVFAKGCWHTADEAIQYSEQVLLRKMSEDEADFMRTCVFERFKGRFTPLVSMLEVMLSRDVNLRDAAEYIEKGYTTTEDGVLEVTSFCKSIASSSRACRATIGWACFKHSVLGGGPSVFKDWHKAESGNWFESGLARLGADEREPCLAICDEYLVRKAYENMHGVTSTEWMQPVQPEGRVETTKSEVTKSAEKYDLVPFCFLRMWKEYKGVLEDMPIFKELLEDDKCPMQLKILSKSTSAFLENNEQCVLPMSDGLKLEDFFCDEQPKCTFLQWIAKDFSTSSAAGRIVFDGTGISVGYFHHLHFPENYVYSEGAVVKDGGHLVGMEPGVDWIPDVYLCFVLVDPFQVVEGLPKWSFKEVAPGKLKVTLLLDNENIKLAFTQAEIGVVRDTCDHFCFRRRVYGK